MANNEFRDLSTEDLQYELESASLKYRKLKFDHSTIGLQNPLELREVRRDIARINTELRSREITAMSDEELADRSNKRRRRRRERKS